MEEARLRTPAPDRHLERLERQPAIIHGADGPTHDEPGVQVENRRQVQLGPLANHKLGGVAGPALVWRGRGEVAIQQVGRDRIRVIAVGRLLESLGDLPRDLLCAH